MKALQVLAYALIVSAALGLSGCHRERVVVREPVYLEPEPHYVIVREPPPSIIVERRPPRPSHTYVWVDGYWNWDGHRYAWEHGRWANPPHNRAVWIAPRYEQHEGQHRFMPGGWRNEGQEPRRDDDRGRGENRGRDEDRGPERGKH
jgi:hypothetical protein